jgi:acyl-CoA reductase-like NAD-dependent aldehyde dehydrogenase
MSSRVDVRRTHKLFIGGQFPRSESGRTYEVTDGTGEFLANVAKASRKDARDAVGAAYRAQPGWASRTAYNRGQILYRIAEVLEGRHEQLAAEVLAAEGGTSEAASRQVDLAVDRLVWYAGWADKLAQVVGGTNPVAAPYFNFSLPEPTGIVAAVAPQRSSLLGLVEVLAPVITVGNVVVAVTSESRPVPAVSLAEVMAASDVPGGVVNLLTGSAAEVAPWLASHMDVNALDLTGVEDPALASELESAAAENLKRVRRPTAGGFDETPGLDRMTWALETKTVWHPMGI